MTDENVSDKNGCDPQAYEKTDVRVFKLDKIGLGDNQHTKKVYGDYCFFMTPVPVH